MGKAQITFFVVIGILVLFAFGFIVYFRGALIQFAEQKPVDIQPVLSHVTHCLDMTATDALDLVGKQGGVIYISQGGLTQDNPPKKVTYWYCPEEKEYIVYMDIVALSNEGCGYPRLNYPYDNDQCQGEEHWKTSVGQSKLPPLYGVDRSHSIQAQLESYINNNLKKCLDFSLFKDFIIDAGDVVSSVLIARKDVAVFIYFPVNITGQTTKNYVDEFTIKEDVRLQMVYGFVKEIITNDTTDPRYDKNGQSTDEGSISSKVFWNVNSVDNMVWVQDIKSRLKFRKPGVDEIYKFWFGVENRQPVMGCIPDKPYEACQYELLVEIITKGLACPVDCCFDDPKCSCCNCPTSTYTLHGSGGVIPVLPSPAGWPVDDLESKWCCKSERGNTIMKDNLKAYSIPKICDEVLHCNCPVGPCVPRSQEITVNVYLEDEAGKYDCNDHEIKVLCKCCCPCPP